MSKTSFHSLPFHTRSAQEHLWTPRIQSTLRCSSTQLWVGPLASFATCVVEEEAEEPSMLVSEQEMRVDAPAEVRVSEMLGSVVLAPLAASVE